MKELLENGLSNLYQTVLNGKIKDVKDLTLSLLEGNFEPQQLIDNALIPAMGEIGARFESGKAFIPNMLLSAKAMKIALEEIKPYLNPEKKVSTGKVVIGTVKGDLHDIGKNLVVAMMEGAGFEVINLGVDVPEDKFVNAVIEHNADILGLSALLTTTTTQMETVINACERAGIRKKVKIMVGGAPISESFSKKIGADAFTGNANAAVLTAKRLIGK